MFLFKSKKIVGLLGVVILFLILGVGGFFYWQNQKDVRELNKTLPKGVKVEKSLFGDEYKVVNKIDGYEFKVPREWMGIKEVEYSKEVTERGYTASSIGLEGNGGSSNIIAIDRFKLSSLEQDLENWAKVYFETFGLAGTFSKDKINLFEVVKTREDVHLGGMYVYIFESNATMYGIANASEEFIREIISNGKW